MHVSMWTSLYNILSAMQHVCYFLWDEGAGEVDWNVYVQILLEAPGRRPPRAANHVRNAAADEGTRE